MSVLVSLSQGRHSIMMLETLAMISSPREDRHNILMQKQPAAQVKRQTANHYQ